MPSRVPARRRAASGQSPSPTLDLFALTETPSKAPSAPPQLHTRPRPPQLWLAVRFAALPLLALQDSAELQAVMEGPPGRQQLVAVTAAAAALGLRPGMSRAAAEVRVPALQLCERQPSVEARALAARAQAAFALTPFVSQEPPDTLLLEIQGSLSLFGGLPGVLQRLQQVLSTAQVPLLHAVAPTVRAALWLVRGRPGAEVRSMPELPGALAALPLTVTGFEELQLETCVRLGISTLGELMRLPRDGLARRLSPEVPQQLDEALGRTPQPRRRHVVAERFAQRVDLPAETHSSTYLQPWCARLLHQQEQFLVQRDAALAECRWHFHHRNGQAPTRLLLARALPGSRACEWEALLSERLARLVLPAAVIGISLRSGPLLPAAPLMDGLPGNSAADQAAALQLLDRLRARLGEEAVHGVCLVPEHRPESAYRRVRPAPPKGETTSVTWPGTARPLWLVAEPQPLAVRDARPWHGGALQLLSGPERIESGWWNGQNVARDYYVARALSGARLWVYRERGGTAATWFLHGVFA